MVKAHQVTATSTLLILAVILLMSLIVAPFVFAAESQQWYLYDTGGPEMVKGTADTGGTVSVGTSGVVWIAHDAAIVDVGFQAATWGDPVLCQINGTAGGSFGRYWLEAQIGVWDGGTFTSYGTSNQMSWNRGQTSNQTFSIAASAFTVQTGEWLALRLYRTGNRNVTVNTTSDSYMFTPASDPGYPTPDASAIIMFAAGLGLLIFIGWEIQKRRCQYNPAGSQ